MATQKEARLRTVHVNGINLRIAEQGDPAKPLVLLMHGWPESWMSWRAQLPALAAAGYHAVAPDMRGYGGSDAPKDARAYDCETIAKDLLELLTLLGKPCYALVGHDWRALLVWHIGLLHPQAFPRLCAMSVPPTLLLSPVLPVAEGMARKFKDNFWYVLYHNEHEGKYGTAWPPEAGAAAGPAEQEYDADPEAALRRLYLSGALGTSGLKGIKFSPPSISDRKRSAGGFIQRLPVPDGSMPDWLPESVFQQYVAEYRRAGFRGGVNYYRNIDRNWHLTRQAFAEAKGKLYQPFLFIAGALDNVLAGSGGPEKAREQVEAVCENLHGCVYIPDCGHWNTQEKPEETNRALLDFLEQSRSLSAPAARGVAGAPGSRL
eukprot:TRINITY_DN61286_c0_g1_i1.p1 TRINITY_DN61286_c0_g1~~TRINITY_DN61286_c0_g1_i1.p1  ORF type:complete len:376 (+),score=69.20 TRINITY_DN61286_c0_g1_i1:55-1182(+)